MPAPLPPRPLEGVLIIDLTCILVGAGAARMLASMGAEVIRIEPADPPQVDLAMSRAMFTAPGQAASGFWTGPERTWGLF
jgi:crotonobetainyl-CoA:carnitine CoA-transferase CaiB-like acyl-CoA transferase